MYFLPIYFRELLEAVCMEEGPSRDIFCLPIRVVQKSLPFLIYILIWARRRR
jgi:hypothetical protein